jgi:FkbM family methyltransferase
MSPLGDRPLGFIAREAVRPSNWVALARMPWRYRHPFDGARRYFTPGGTYPYRCEVRTPRGVVAPALHSQHDMITVNEVFCREDYRVGDEAEVIVDIGSNIGISALYFLTRGEACHAYLYEPDPRNVARLRANLAPFAGRWQLREAAVGPEQGVVEFGREPTGRYGAVGAQTSDILPVQCLEINRVLEEVLDSEQGVDVLKIDTEGLEAPTVAAIRPELLDRITLIYFESESPARLHDDRFEVSFANETVALRRSDALTRR